MTTLQATSYGARTAGMRPRSHTGWLVTLALVVGALATVAVRGLPVTGARVGTGVGMLADPASAPDDRPLLLPDR